MCDKDTMSYEKCKDCEFCKDYLCLGESGIVLECSVTGKQLTIKHCPKPCQSSQDKQDDEEDSYD